MANDPTAWNRTVPFIEDGQPVKASVPNASTQVLADRTAALKAIVDALEAGEQLLLRNAPLSENVPEGSVVYMRSDNLEHDLALAVWEDLVSSGGRLFPAESAVYSGVVLSKSSDRVGDVLLSGIGLLSSAGETNLFNGVTPEVGTYYLSMLNAGTVELADPVMAVRVLKYMGDNVVQIFPPQHEPITHTHREFSLVSSEWLAAASFPAAIVPAGATYGYDLSSAGAVAQNLAEAILPSVGEPVFVNVDNTVDSLTPGIHIPDTLAILDENGIWWTGAAPDGDIEMTVTSADAKGKALLNAIESTNSGITITVNNGRVSVTLNDFTEALDIPGHVVVKSFNGQEQQRGPVVERVNVGVGLTRTSPEGDGQGTVTITQTLFDNFRISANLMNLDNAVTNVDGIYVFTQFPANRAAAVNCEAMLPNLSSAVYEAVIWAQFMSPDSSQLPPSVEATLVPTPDAAGVTPAAAGALSFPSFPVAVPVGDVFLLETTTQISLVGFSEGTVLWKISADNPTKELRMINTGIRLVLIP